MRRDGSGTVPGRHQDEMTGRMSYRAKAERGVVGRLCLLLLLALGLMHLLAHAGDTGLASERETATHTHTVHSEPTTPEPVTRRTGTLTEAVSHRLRRRSKWAVARTEPSAASNWTPDAVSGSTRAGAPQ